MSTNVRFDPVDPPIKHQYAATLNHQTVERVLWKGDWAMSIQVDGDMSGPGVYVYWHWKEHGFWCHRAASMEAARAYAVDALTTFENFIRRQFFRPKEKL